MENIVYVQKNVTLENKLPAMETLLEESEFWSDIAAQCAQKRKSASTCKIVIKPNISIASQKALPSYTDPQLVNHLTSMLRARGYQQIDVVESENMYHIGYENHTPNVVGENIGYTDVVKNLSTDPQVCFDEYKGQKIHVCLSRRMLDADYFINFPKGRNHCMYKVTGALKNLFGTIPTFDKIGEFHHMKSGLDVPHVVEFVHEKTPPSFTIMDWVRSVDDKDVHMSSKPLTYYKDANRLIASKSALAVDTYLHQKMGYAPFESDVVQPVAKTARYPQITVQGDNLDHVKNWKTVPWSTRLKYKFLFQSIKMARKMKPAETRMKQIMRNTVRMDVLDDHKQEEKNDVKLLQKTKGDTLRPQSIASV